MLVQELEEYQGAIKALTQLKDIQGNDDKIKAIARLLIKLSEMPVTESVLRFVGDGSPQDQDVIQTYQEALTAIILGAGEEADDGED